MPLPSLREYGAKRCRAKSKRSGNQCQNPAAYGMPVCRMHGARCPHAILKGKEHPNYRHGNETSVARAARSAKMVELRTLEGIVRSLAVKKRM